MGPRGRLLKSARLVKRHYIDSVSGELFAEIEEHLEVDDGFRVPRWLPKVFQYILDDFSRVDELSRTDFLSCLLTLCRLFPEGKALEFASLRESLGELPSWDRELAHEVLRAAA